MTLRLFAALPVPDEIAERLVHLQKGVKGAKWSPRENFHITLKFFGDMDESTAGDLDAELACARVKPFSLALKGAGSFGKADPHAIWIGVESHPSLMLLARACDRAARRAGLEAEKRRYTPHVTLAYLKHAELDRVLAFERRCALFSTPAFTVDRFYLYSSHTRPNQPNLYRIEAEYPLG
ncbi:RNA 2',3'-cyclic phosphodiesterase [Hyphobacterium sp. SN044]|uniref:RNA 2',3'-cyclic phosphodiesterase n=1 Tax=Hyphobacterium sp. SN044 TaxID=2912575 RepID=UPI001F02C284|nr:RNA 2',3'-cyclic phosphodiesterase [Hyphobacterium sp. SN044]MCF8881016.1 RNA 2',3'-cyclic phosphodiesterase [Hyphobacterium sp. SN044]